MIQRIIKNIKNSLTIIISIVLALVVAYVGARYYKQEVISHKETTVVIVASKTISPYTVLGKDVLKKIEVPVDRVDSNAVNNPEELFGKLTTTKIYPNEQIHREKITSNMKLKDKEIVSVNVDITRSGAGWIQSGDMVDVWYLGGDSQVPGSGNALIANNAYVLDIRDSSGHSIYEGTQAVMSAVTSSIVPSSPPAIAVLVVESQYVPKVISGSSTNNTVLVKKFSDTKKLYQPETVENIEKEESGAEKGEENLKAIQNMFGQGE